MSDSWLAQSSTYFPGIPNATVLCSGLTVGFLFWQWIALDSDLKRKRQSLDDSIKFLRGFNGQLKAADYKKLDDFFSAERHPFRNQWKEYDETLIKPDPNDPDKPVCNTKQAELYFTPESIIDIDFNAAWYSAVPSLLTAIGLFGTFLSIYLALSALQIKDDNFTNITGFINNLSGKFISSLFGLGSAFVFTWVERTAIGELSSQISKLHVELNRLTEQRPQELLLQEMADAMVGWSGSFGSLSDVLPAAIENAVRATIEPKIQAMTEHLQKVEELTEKSVERRDESVTRLVTQVVAAFREALMQETQEQFGTLAVAISKTIQIVDEFNSRMSESVEHSSKLFVDMKTWQEEQIARLLERERELQKEVLAAVQEQLTRISDEQKQRQDVLTSEMVTVVDRINKNNERSIDNIADKLHKIMTTLTDEVEKSSSKQLELLKTKHEQMVYGLTSWIETSNHELEKLLDKIAAQTDKTDQTVRSLDGVVGQFNVTATAYRDTVSDVRTLLDLIQETSEKIAAVSSRLNLGQEQLLENLSSVAERQKEYDRLLKTQDSMVSKFQDILSAPSLVAPKVIPVAETAVPVASAPAKSNGAVDLNGATDENTVAVQALLDNTVDAPLTNNEGGKE